MIRIVPNIPKIQARWAHRASEIPDWLEVPMSDGTVVQYYPKVEQPAFTETIRIIRKMTDERVGYKRTGECYQRSPAEDRDEYTVVSIPQKERSDK